ncbi:MAG TPA: carbohydrate kinase family protein [Methanocorpusculum sp.]|nr:carbohydrate kinase family protein [Candidatus Methanocorpusculum faecipullorum]HJK23065.1 carbohydrate kinase family protein [Methanocorpusculum sp.]HJK45331.1 carbohydrate kinase family protein [Methanocorpusculum sp.]HJK49973.1 carbohydrate kinase family protein [Methanocorpusculum sp.]HJK65702.1 carbohydrate kinase family protein [Methanocorpusculum sp.]
MNDPIISVCGHLCNDYIIAVEEYPAVGTSCRVTDRQNYYGGGAANIAVGIAKLGGTAELIAAVGRDYPGSAYEQHLKEMGVTTRLFRTDKENCSTAFMVNNAAGDQITYFEWGASALFATADAPSLSFAHMATGDADFNVKVARQAEFATFDPGQDVKYYEASHLREIFENIDMLICNNFEAEIMCGKLGWTEKELIASVPVAILTKGKNGSVLYQNGDVVEIPACPVTMVDPTGAGDAYRAGLLTAYRRGYALPVCCKIGAVTSSFAVEKVGTQTNLADWEQMSERYAEQFGTLKKSE